jgi:3-dehydroquinate synthetase
MNFIFSKEKVPVPKYVSGSKPYIIDVNKILLRIRNRNTDSMQNTSIYLMNMLLHEEFEFALKKKKTSILYVNPSLSLESLKNIKKALPGMGIDVKKYVLVDDESLKKLHRHVDQVIKSR